MEAASIPWRPIGELFVEKGLISQAQLEEALAEQEATGHRLGEILVKRNLISSPELTQALMEQLGREVAKEEGFGTGLWSEIRRRNTPSGSGPEPVLREEDRSPFGEGLAKKLGVVPDEPFDSPAPSDSATIEETESAQLWEVVARPAEEEADQTEADILRESLKEAHFEIDALRQVVAERQQLLETLDTEIVTLRAAAETHDDTVFARVDALQQELAVAQDELGTGRARVEELETALHERDGQITQLQQALAELANRSQDPSADPRAATLEQELSTVRTEVAELTTSLADARGKASEQESALTAERQAHGETRQHLDDATRAEESSRQAFLEIELGFGAVQAERDAARSEASASHDALGERENELAALRDRVAAAETELGAEREAHADTRRHTDETAADAAKARQLLDGLEQEGRELAERARTLEQELGTRQATESRLLEQLETAQGRTGELEHEVSGLAAQLEQIEQERRALIERARTLEEELASGHANGSRLEEELRAAQHRTDELTGRIAGLADELDAVRRERDELAERARTLDEDLAYGQENVAHLEERLHTSEGRAAELSDKVVSLAGRLEAAESLLEESESASEAARREADAAAARLNAAETRITELNTTADRLDGEKTQLSKAFSNQRLALEHELGTVGARLAEEAAAHSETRCVLSRALTELAAREPIPTPGDESEPGPQDYLCFTPTKGGYRLVVRTGLLPAAGDECDVDGVAHLVTRVARSPLPFDSRTCVYLIGPG